MKILLAIVLTLAALYSGFWIVTTRGLDAGLTHVIEQAERQGWTIGIEDRDTAGFPSRFDVTATGIDVTSPDGALRWQAPQIQTAALSYRPNRIIATMPPNQTLGLGTQMLAIGSQAMRVSLNVDASTDVGLDSLTVEAATMDIASDAGWQVTTGPALAAVRRNGPVANSYDLYVTAADMVPAFDRSGLAGQPDQPAVLTMQASFVTDRPLDRASIQTPAVLQSLTLDQFDLTWGDLALRGEGQIDVDANGLPEGRIEIQVAQWQSVLTLVDQLGVLPDNLQGAIRTGLGFLSGGRETLSLPLVFDDGQMALGPIPLGPAPILR